MEAGRPRTRPPYLRRYFYLDAAAGGDAEGFIVVRGASFGVDPEDDERNVVQLRSAWGMSSALARRGARRQSCDARCSPFRWAGRHCTWSQVGAQRRPMTCSPTARLAPSGASTRSSSSCGASHAPAAQRAPDSHGDRWQPMAPSVTACARSTRRTLSTCRASPPMHARVEPLELRGRAVDAKGWSPTKRRTSPSARAALPRAWQALARPI